MDHVDQGQREQYHEHAQRQRRDGQAEEGPLHLAAVAGAAQRGGHRGLHADAVGQMPEARAALAERARRQGLQVDVPPGDAEADGGDQQGADVVADALAPVGALEVGQREHRRQGPQDDAVEDAQRAGLEAEGALQVQVAEAERGQADAEGGEVEGADGGHGELSKTASDYVSLVSAAAFRLADFTSMSSDTKRVARDGEYYAHSSSLVNRKEWHKLSKHLAGTGQRAAKFLEIVDGCADIGKAAGLLHDVGKYSAEFQARLQGDSRRVDHSTAGAQIASQRYEKIIGKSLAFCIAGHHAGLADGVQTTWGKIAPLEARLQRKIPKLSKVWKNEIETILPDLRIPNIKPRDQYATGFSIAFFIRMVFSALVDADYLDTEDWVARSEGRAVIRGHHLPLDELSKRLDLHLSQLHKMAKPSEVNQLRQDILTHVLGKAKEDFGLFKLTVPTGGGKTLTSLAFALAHAIHNGLSRIIYVIPFTSIVDQTAKIFREALNDGQDEIENFVIEHHSAFDEETISSREARQKLFLAMENWDAPIIVTTAVQFFESLFANRPSRCRKLHNIANSVVILDEAQTLPLKLLGPCLSSLDELTRNWRTSVVLCTATQPALDKLACDARGLFHGFENPRELAPNPEILFRKLERTRIIYRGKFNDIQLAEQLRVESQVLCIVNKRRHAGDLYKKIKECEGAYYLTTLMCASHRRDHLSIIKERLLAGMPVRLVATSLIEAGVDVDFPVVWRATAGLESIIQAAGRCNREGRENISDVFVFEPVDADGHTLRPPPEIGQLADVARDVMRRRSELHTPEAIEDYFHEVYKIRGSELDAKNILGKLRERQVDMNFPFETVAKEFRMIETDMVPIIVRYCGMDGSDSTVTRLLNELEHVDRPGRVARRLQPYTVQVPPQVRKTFLETDAAKIIREEDFDKQFVVLANSDIYFPDIGLTWEDPAYREASSLLV